MDCTLRFSLMLAAAIVLAVSAMGKGLSGSLTGITPRSPGAGVAKNPSPTPPPPTLKSKNWNNESNASNSFSD